MTIKIPLWLRGLVYGTHSLLSGFITAFFSHAKWAAFYRNIPLRYLNFPLSLLFTPLLLSLNVFLLILSSLEFFNSGIKNMANFFVELIKTTQTAFSLSSLLILIPTATFLVPLLSVIAITTEALVNLANCLIHARQWYQAVTVKDIEKQKMLTAKFGINFIAGAFLSVGISLTFLSGIGPITLLPVGILTAAITVIGGLISIGVGYYVDRIIAAAKQSDLNDAPLFKEDSIRSSTARLSLHLSASSENRSFETIKRSPSTPPNKTLIATGKEPVEEYQTSKLRSSFH